MTITQIPEITAPAAEKRRSTLLDVATVVDGIAWQDGTDLFSSWNHLTFGERSEFCGAGTKTLDQLPYWVDGFRFAAYGGVTCKLSDQDEQEAGVREAFLKGESTAVEAAMMEIRFVENAAGGAPGEWPAPTDITPAAGAVSPRVAVALLEEAAAALYVGVPTLHLPLSISGLLLDLAAAEFEGDIIRTKSGAKVVAGAGYANPNTSPTGVAAAAGERWVYATGEVWIAKAPEVVVRSAMDTSTNEIVTLAERGYIGAVDSFAIAIRSTVTD